MKDLLRVLYLPATTVSLRAKGRLVADKPFASARKSTLYMLSAHFDENVGFGERPYSSSG
jgi:hypothetical protein